MHKVLFGNYFNQMEPNKFIHTTWTDWLKKQGLEVVRFWIWNCQKLFQLFQPFRPTNNNPTFHVSHIRPLHPVNIWNYFFLMWAPTSHNANNALVHSKLAIFASFQKVDFDPNRSGHVTKLTSLGVARLQQKNSASKSGSPKNRQWQK